MVDFAATLQETIESFQLYEEAEPYFPVVRKGFRLSHVPLQKPQVMWRTLGTREPPEGPRNIQGRRSVAMVFQVACYWPLAGDDAVQEKYEDDIADVLLNLPAAIVALTPASPATTYEIAGRTVNLVTVEDDSIVEEEPIGDAGPDRRVVRFEVHARILEAS